MVGLSCQFVEMGQGSILTGLEPSLYHLQMVVLADDMRLCCVQDGATGVGSGQEQCASNTRQQGVGHLCARQIRPPSRGAQELLCLAALCSMPTFDRETLSRENCSWPCLLSGDCGRNCCWSIFLVASCELRVVQFRAVFEVGR